MATTVTNQSSTTYTLSGSSEIRTATSNENAVILEDLQGLNLTKTANATSFTSGSIITYTIRITNNSGQFFTGVRIIDNLAGGNLAYVIGSARLTVNTLTYPVNPVNTNPLTFTLQQLNPGQSMTLTYNAQVIFNLPPSVTSLTNNVQGIGYTSSGTITGFTSHTIQRSSSGNLVLTKSASLTNVLPNEVFSYYLTYTNNSSSEATIVTTTDELPTNFIITGISVKIGTSQSFTLDSSDYNLSSSNVLSFPSTTGPVITVPAGGATLVTISGYFA